MQAVQKGDPQTPKSPALTGPTYRLPSSVKTMLSTIRDPQLRAAWKNSMIEAYAWDQKLQLELSKKKDKKKSGKQDDLL
jgi:hypothetical protein